MDPQARPAVEKIIALKRHEQPPPGYFRLLPERIIHRIEQGEGRSIFWETWGLAFRVRPVLAYALGLTVCAALTAGIWFVPRMDRSTVAATFRRPVGGGILQNRGRGSSLRRGTLAGQHQSGPDAANR